MNQKINIGDYLVLKHAEKASVSYSLVKAAKVVALVKSAKVVGTKFRGTIESERKGLVVNTVEATNDQVLLNLGSDPDPGKVYGLDLTNRFRRCIEHPFWGNVLLFTRLETETLKLVKASLDRTAKKIEKLGLEHYTSLIDTHLVAKQGKWAGKYYHRPPKSETEDSAHYVAYAPEFAANDAKIMDYVVFHEFGHVVRYNGVLGKKLRVKWLKEYTRSIADFEITKTELKEVFDFLENCIDQEVSLGKVLRDFIAEDESHAPWIKAILRWFKEVHHLSPKDLSVLWDSQDLSSIKELWPTRSIDTSTLAPVVSDYACVNVEELFAEAFAFYCVGKKLPSRITQLVEASIQYAKAVSK